ncbi:hydrogenase expression/formation protein HypE [Salisediminibacterium beveridgei]|uniref:[NiFe] hydrogenase metallocenter assembly protein HypE n=1 Tax=Salisediminibacterium beveridgei TaxID=632773 RepID=A0A1D7QXD9_9BACI|nr:hydrogenase expression/formation protein HypE [Salisediminibacterium beveridgei]AOM83669.1 [NiFe] hydrogenase metallocenter assembly protein HypE [Salisediminibacterium beveridgei]
MIRIGSDFISLAHGDGGQKTHDLIRDIFVQAFEHHEEAKWDAALVHCDANRLAITTDSFVVSPRHFPGGDIGKLAVAGTVNDLAVSFATPKWLTCGLIIEEGFSVDELRQIVLSMAEEARKANVKIIAGDTKVVEHGACDGLFINTTGVGLCDKNHSGIPAIEEGDVILVNGTVGDHGMTLMALREDLPITNEVESDCASLNHLIHHLRETHPFALKFMRDATRGGLATTLIEACSDLHLDLVLEEEEIPLSPPIKGACDLLGYDPLYVANEGKVVMIVKKDEAKRVLQTMKAHPLGEQAAIIGHIKHVECPEGRLFLRTALGVDKVKRRLPEIQLPRIC